MEKTRARGGHVSVRLTEEERAAAEDLFMGDGGEEERLGIAMSMRYERVYVGPLSSEWSVTGLIAWLRERLAIVPEEYRESAEMEFYSDYSSVDVSIKYLRPPTTEEVEADRAEEKRLGAGRLADSIDDARRNVEHWKAELRKLEAQR